MKELSEEVLNVNEKCQKEIAELRKKLAEKSHHELMRIQEVTRARYKNKGEKYTKYWFKLNKKKMDSQIILALQDNEGKLTHNTKEMMEIASTLPPPHIPYGFHMEWIYFAWNSCEMESLLM